MGFWRRLFGSKDRPDQPKAEQALLLHIRFDGSGSESAAASGRETLAQRLADALHKSGAGSLDGSESGPDRCTLFMYGPDADAMWVAVEPVLRSRPFALGSHVVKRYGPPGIGHQSRVELPLPA